MADNPGHGHYEQGVSSSSRCMINALFVAGWGGGVDVEE